MRVDDDHAPRFLFTDPRDTIDLGIDHFAREVSVFGVTPSSYRWELLSWT